MNFFNLQDHVNLLSIIGAALIVLITFFVVGKYVKQMKESKTHAELSDESWDGITEYKNELPIGWAISFIVILIWAIWYFLIGYPLNSYSQIGEYNEEVKAHNSKFEEKFANPSQDTLIEMGRNIFIVECTPCHGINAEGMDGKAQNLARWGSEAGIEAAILEGSSGLGYMLGEMPAGMATGNDAKAIAAYVAKELSTIKTTSHPELVGAGKEAFSSVCAACHGEDGKGMDGQSPDLTKYGSSDFLVEVLNKGKVGLIGTMPKFGSDGKRFTEIQKRAVAEYVLSLSK